MQSGQGFTLVIGLFFDGTGNNAINTRAMLDICREENIDISTPLAGELLVRYAQERFGLSGLEATSYTGYFTNIHWLSTLYATEFPAGSHLVQYPVYIEGIGTQAGEPDCLIGQGLGISDTGVLSRTDRAVQALPGAIQQALSLFRSKGSNVTVRNLRFDLFGFSRGAAAACHFAGRVHSGDTAIINAVQEGMGGTEYAGVPGGSIRFIGLFDTVAATGLLSNGFNPHSADTGDVNILLRPGVADNVFHITAAHECRYNFALRSVKPAWPEVALPGVHSDTGGGYLPAHKEDVFLTRPVTDTVPFDCPGDVTQGYIRTRQQHLQMGAFPAVAPILRTSDAITETWADSRMPVDRYGQFRKRSYSALTLKNRVVKHDWSKVALLVMLDAARDAGVAFDQYTDMLSDSHSPLFLPEELGALCEKALELGKAARQGQKTPEFTQDDIDVLARTYIHCSANWNNVQRDADGVITGGALPSETTGFVNRPDERWVRTVYNMDGEKITD